MKMCNHRLIAIVLSGLLCFTAVPITAFAVGAAGTEETMTEETGPCAGFLLLFWVRLVPWLAFWGLMQGLYNLLPVYPMDGGRALRCALLSRWTPEQADSVSRWVSLGVGGIMAVLAVYAACGLHLGLWAALAAGLFLWRMLNCIQREPR